MEYYENLRVPPAPRLFRVSPQRPLALLAHCPAYRPTPIVECPALAAELGVSSLVVKNESVRMGLGSFKALGGAFAVAHMLGEEATRVLGRPIEPEELVGAPVKAIAGQTTFITASAGNHGLSVAAGAKVFGARAVIVLSEAVPEAFADRIRALGAQVARTPGSYENSVAAAIAMADGNGWRLLADGSWPGYIDPPALVMEGYTVLGEECRSAFAESGGWPSHVFLQAGVGGLAASLAAHIRETWPRQPAIVVVEPEAAPCLIRSVEAGKMVHAEGPDSNMGRLDCKDASLIAFEALRRDADIFATVTDDQAREAACRLAGCDLATTPSGGAGLAALSAMAADRAAGLEANSRCLLIVSEGPE